MLAKTLICAFFLLGIVAADDEFICSQSGIFPDPYDCRKYYICAEKDGSFVAFPYSCESNFVFDRRRHECTTNRLTACNAAVSYPCTGVAEGPVRDNSRMYYQCWPTSNGYGPRLFNCPGGQAYLDGKCHDLGLPLNLSDEGLCTELGSFYVPDCSSYNQCDKIGVAPVLEACKNGHYFDPIRQVCVEKKCASVYV